MKQRSAGQPAGSEADNRPLVLIVEDEADQLDLLTLYFHRAGCTVIGRSDAENALALAAGLVPSLMVIDLRLPGITGWELVAQLRARYPGCPIAITSVLDVQDYPPSDWVLPKPVTRRDVEELVTELIPGGVT